MNWFKCWEVEKSVQKVKTRILVTVIYGPESFSEESLQK